MHIARNRRASRQTISKNQKTHPAARSARNEQDFMLRGASPPGFASDMILSFPPHALSSSADEQKTDTHPAQSSMSPVKNAPTARNGAPQSRRPKGKKARKAAMRMADEQSSKTASPNISTSPRAPLATVEAQALPLSQAAAQLTYRQMASDILTPRASASADLALTKITRHAEPKGALALAPAKPAFLLQSAPEPLVTGLTPVAALSPLPRSRALAPARRQGLVDVIAFFLRDSGRRLARWSAQRQKTREERALLNAAVLRKHMLKSQLDALEALRQQRPR